MPYMLWSVMNAVALCVCEFECVQPLIAMCTRAEGVHLLMSCPWACGVSWHVTHS